MTEIRPLSPTRAMRLLASTPAHCLVDQERTREMNRGTIIHAMVLPSDAPRAWCVVSKTDAKTGVVEDAGDYRTKSAQEHRDAIIERGDLPILRKELAACELAAAGIKAQLGPVYLPNEGRYEVPLDWVDVVPCRGKADIVTDDHVGDLKTCEDALRASSDSAIYSMAYDVQAAAYLEAAEHERPELAGRLRYFLHFAEIDQLPNGARTVITVEVAGSMLELGRARWKRAKALWLRCHEHSDWPGYSREVRRAEAPPWALAADLNASLTVDLPDPKVSF